MSLIKRALFSALLVAAVATAAMAQISDENAEFLMEGEPQKVIAALKKGTISMTDTHSEGFSPIHFVSFKQPLEVVKFLIDSGADVNLRASNGVTPLMAAAGANTPEVVSYLLKNGARISDRALEGETPLWVAATQNTDPEVFKLLISAGANINAQNKDGASVLAVAVKSHNTTAVLALCDAGANALLNEDGSRVSLLDFAKTWPNYQKEPAFWALNALTYDQKNALKLKAVQ